MIRITCQHCSVSLQVKDRLAGRTGKCPACGGRIVIPSPESEQTTRPTATAWSGEGSIPFDDSDDEGPASKIVHSGGMGLGATDKGSSTASEAAPAVDLTHVMADDYVPQHLGTISHYLICDHKDLIAQWQCNGKGWMLKQKNGFSRVNICASEIPSQGKFTLIEVGVEHRDDGVHLRNISSFRLAEQYALNELTKGDDAILKSITGPDELNDLQKKHVRELVKSRFLPHIWAAMHDMLE